LAEKKNLEERTNTGKCSNTANINWQAVVKELMPAVPRTKDAGQQKEKVGTGVQRGKGETGGQPTLGLSMSETQQTGREDNCMLKKKEKEKENGKRNDTHQREGPERL